MCRIEYVHMCVYVFVCVSVLFSVCGYNTSCWCSFRRWYLHILFRAPLSLCLSFLSLSLSHTHTFLLSLSLSRVRSSALFLFIFLRACALSHAVSLINTTSLTHVYAYTIKGALNIEVEYAIVRELNFSLSHTHTHPLSHIHAHRCKRP